jgi:hypothetical protein
MALAPDQETPEMAQAEAAAGGKEQQQGSGAEVADKLLALQQALSSIAQGAGEGSGLPPEAVDAIQGAASSYNQFLSIVGKKLGIEVPDVKAPAADAAAAPKGGAMPADMPMMGRNARMVKPTPAM